MPLEKYLKFYFGLKYSKGNIPEGKWGEAPSVFRSIYVLFSKNSLLFPWLSFYFPELSFYFPGPLDTGHKLTYIRRSEDDLDVFWTSYVRSIYVLCPGWKPPFVFQNCPLVVQECLLFIYCARFFQEHFFAVDCTFASSSELLRETVYVLLLFCFLLELFIGHIMIPYISFVFTFKQ